ncbi:MAG: F0F1 ATP synthase subunit delta [Atopobiaceae bacterium]|jgi:F-type H+-transporting ATPase subunit delta|uniref:ATP synthase subunit delta n=1 Tax=Olsenella absiana TaxID=3115222 RepID=A0ABU7RAY1_9ACTN|nr:F0F1 ATP synthase subunit delta [Olsenella sp.]MDD7364065.1 F0F1 ATP synthase subunit delta [Olsenella sp.]MDY3900226.1 F0F1 ATP synthase subunit delta [Atopobiaceae bacterium]
MTGKRIEQKKVEAYTRALLEAAKSEGRAARDLEQVKHVLKFSPEVLETITAMQGEDDFDLLDKVYSEYKGLLDKSDDTVSVDVTTAVPMDDEMRERVREKCRKDFDAPVYLVEHVDPSILGGIILEAKGHRRDASVKAQLINVRKKLSSANMGGDE